MTNTTTREPHPASIQDGAYPRPQLVRARWADLTGTWSFAFDDDDRGQAERWQDTTGFSQKITVPFPPESPASGIDEPKFHPIVWYERTIAASHLAAADHVSGHRLILHFGAVDYRAVVWVNGQVAARHEGGYTPFSADVTDLLGHAGPDRIVVRAEDDPTDVAQPRGKQDWQEEPHVIWYKRTTGIWQPVWLESRPATAIETVHWDSDLTQAEVRLHLQLSRKPRHAVPISVQLSFEGGPFAEEVSTQAAAAELELTIPVPALANGQAQQDYTWSPEHPRLIDARIRVGHDVVTSYFGLRTASASAGSVLLNGTPVFMRGVLDQGYWPRTHLAAPSPEALREEVTLIRAAGFNMVRVHQTVADPRFLYWADKLGLMVWAEFPAAYAFSATAIRRTMTEWLEALSRDKSHPSIVAWVPFNESWGVQDIARDPQMRHYVTALSDLTRAVDPTRIIISNDGWEHVNSDVVTVHDYESDPASLRRRYATLTAADLTTQMLGPAGRLITLTEPHPFAPILLSEFGGVSFDSQQREETWGYSQATTGEDFAEKLQRLFAAVNTGTHLAGYCYTQFTDTGQERNGILTDERTHKLDPTRLRNIVLGRSTTTEPTKDPSASEDGHTNRP